MFEALQTQTIQPVPHPIPTKIKGLLLDDSQFDRQRIRRLSRKSDLPIVLDEIDSIEALPATLSSEQYDVILLDYRLPVGSGIQALELIKKDPRNRHAAKIMITGAGEVATAVEAMREGCHDYRSKDTLDVSQLHTSMTNALTISRERYQLERATAHQREVIKVGLASALQDKEVQASVAQLVRSEFEEHRKITAHFDSPRMSSEMDALVVELLRAEEDDEFIFH